MKEEIERLKEHILNYDVCKNLYNNRKIIINKKLKPIMDSIPVFGGRGRKFEELMRYRHIENKMKIMMENKQLTEEEYDFYNMNFNDYIFKYGYEYL